MKIVSVMTTSSSGGAEFAAVEMLDALAARGHECVMVSDVATIARDTGLRLVPIAIGPKLSTRSYVALALRWVPYTRRLARVLEAELPYDVLLVHYKKEQLMVRGLPERLRRGVVWCEWGPVPFPLRKGLPKRAYLAAAELARVVLAISPGTGRNLVDVGVPAAKVEVVDNVVRTDEIDFTATGRARVRTELGIADDAFVVGCISRFNHKKRNDVVVSAAIALDDERVHVILAGDGEMEASLRALGAPLGDRLHIIPTPRGDVGDVLSAFDVSVFCPSPTEGQPRAVILGMLARRPCLSTGAEGVADMIRPAFGTITSPENDPRSLAAALRPYMTDPELARRQGEAARAFAEHTYAAPVVAEHLEAVLVAAMEGAPASPPTGARARVRVRAVATPRLLGRVRRQLRQRVDMVRGTRAMRPDPVANATVEWIGTDYGGWALPRGTLTADSTVYLAGVGEDVTFDLELIRRFGCTVDAFDPVPEAAAHVARVAGDEPRLRFHPVGLWSQDTTLHFHENPNPGFVSRSATDMHGATPALSAAVRSLPSLMAEAGHDHLDLLKLSVEGSEIVLVDEVLDRSIDVRVLCVEWAQPSSLAPILAAHGRLVRGGWTLAGRRLRPFGWKSTYVRRAA